MTAGVCVRVQCEVWRPSAPGFNSTRCVLAPDHDGPCSFPAPGRRRDAWVRAASARVEPRGPRRDADDLDLVGVRPELAADEEVAALADLGSVRVRYLPRCKRCGRDLQAEHIVPMLVLDRNGGLSAGFCAVDCAIGWLRELRESCG